MMNLQNAYKVVRVFCHVSISVLFPALTIVPNFAQSDFDTWQKSQSAEYESYQQEEARAFQDYLDREWKSYDLSAGQKQESTPKPKALPKAPPVAATPPSSTDKPVVIVPPPQPAKIPETPGGQPRTPAIPAASLLRVDFYGRDVAFSKPQGFNVTFAGSPSGPRIAAFWKDIEAAPYREYLKQAQAVRDDLKLNDWGYALLIYRLAAALYPASQENARVLFTWHLLAQGGMQVRVGYSGERVVLLAATTTTLYGLPYFTLAGRKYYTVALDGRGASKAEALTTYDDNGQGGGNQKPLDLGLRAYPQFGGGGTKTYSFVYRGQSHKVEAKVNAGAVAFFRDYPQTEQGVYFNAASNPEGRALLLSLAPLVKGKSEREAADVLLRFVQTAFAYKIDEEQFGREKNLFPEETLHYPFSDCDDRAVLFAYLVRALLGLPVVGLDYPGHVATAVRFGTPQRGDAITHQGAEWLVCDPTFINASPGMVMPQFKNVTPGIIAVR
jgi:hypothetical protein